MSSIYVDRPAGDSYPDRASVIRSISEVAEELCDARRHTEPVYDTDLHGNRRMRRAYTTTQPGLLAQLAEAAYPGSTDGTASIGGAAGSRAPGCVEAISRHSVISIASARWCWDLRIDLRDTVESNIRAVVGSVGALDDEQLCAFRSDLYRWRTWAATLTGWRMPPISPRVPCPQCGGRGTLRVNLERKTGYCTSECGATWDSESIVKLATHISTHLDLGRARSDLARARERQARAEQDAERERRLNGAPAA